MAFSASIDGATKLGYFLAGALLPTIAFLFFKPRQELCKQTPQESQEYEESDDSSDELQEALGAPSTDCSKWGIRDAPYKLVLVVNKELKMGKGKIAAQCCHAAVGCYKRAAKTCPAGVKAWERTGCAKIAVQSDTQDEMEEILVRAYQMGIPCYLVEDAGRTQIAAGSRTVLGLGPAPVRVYDGLTSHLKLM